MQTKRNKKRLASILIPKEITTETIEAPSIEIEASVTKNDHERFTFGTERA